MQAYTERPRASEKTPDFVEADVAAEASQIHKVPIGIDGAVR